MEGSSINIVGVSPEAVKFIRSFMSQFVSADGNDTQLVPIIGLVHSSTHRNESGEVFTRGEHFVLGAISKSKIEDEIFFNAEGIEIAIRIPSKPRFYGSYYFDLQNGELVNARI